MDYYVIGDPELITAFRFVGIGGISVADAAGAKAAFLRVTRGVDETAGVVLPGQAGEGCRVLIVTEEVADWLGQFLIDWQLSDRYPLVVEIPGILGRLPGRKTLVDSIREAIGIHV